MALQKVSLSLGRLTFQFASTAELRDALLGSFEDADYAGGPFVMVNGDDTAPAWSWVIDLVRTRSDWRASAGIALQHASNDGGDLAKQALAGLLANYRDSVVLLQWTTPLAHRWPDVRASSSGTGWGLPDRRLDAIVADQQRYWSEVTNGRTDVYLADYGPGGKAINAPLVDDASLRALLEKTAKAGRFPDGNKGPWSWLVSELLFSSWLPATLPNVLAAFTRGSDAEVRALLDWFADGCDLWRFIDLFESWRRTPPPWWNDAADTKPSGWRYNIRSAHWPNVKTLGDIALEGLKRAQAQAATPAVLDLAPLP